MRNAWMPLALAALALAACAAGLLVDPATTLGSWLAAELFWLSLPLGALALSLIQELSGGAWLRPFAPWTGSAIATLPVLALGIVPVLAAGATLYPWAAPGAEGAPWWLNPPFFVGRTLVYFALWLSIAVAWLRAGGRLGSRNAAVALILLAFTTNFAAIDWAMSLDPRFASSIYGYTAIAAMLVTAAALLLLGARAGDDVLALAGLCLALVLVWAYLAFMQYLIVWESDLPREIPWYLRRQHGAWPVLWAVVAATHAAAFLMLLSRRVRRGGGALTTACVLLLAGRVLDACWLVLPDVRGAALSWQAPAAVLAIGALMGAAFRRRWVAERARHV